MKTETKNMKTIPFGRIAELRQNPDAALIALKPGYSLFSGNSYGFE